MEDDKDHNMEENESAPLKDDREEIEIDEVMEQIGDTKPYQWFVIMLLCLEELFIAFQSLASVFIAAEPRHWCKDPEFNDENVTTSHILYNNNTTLAHSQCEMYINGSIGTNTTSKCTEFEYDKSVFKSSIVTEVSINCT
eukprot:GHVU01009652.1.p1 GENE.GHVU01009652.1~~GHVU01009652.1.p1  ORF type:complete len:140 (-),score=23.70 GHVU01009652.1:525-944(-)